MKQSCALYLSGLVMLSLAAFYYERACAMDFALVSTAFENRGTIPSVYTCDGQGISPELSWSGVPKGTESLALIVDDPDAPMAQPFVHWVIFNILPTRHVLEQGIPPRQELADGARQGINSARKIGYTPPCPPSGSHRYFFTLYALDTVLDARPGITKDELLQAIHNHIIAQTELMGRYQRRSR